MIEPTRQEILTSLARLSELAPDMRFGQVIANLAFMAAGPWDQTLWDLEDEQLVGAIRKMESDLSQRASEVGMATDRAALIGRVLQTVRSGDPTAARDILRADYPFVAVSPESRRYTEVQSLQVFIRDGFVDRYSGQRLVFPGVLRLLSRLLPQEFPFHPNWKMSETHAAYWELFPTIDHVLPVARGGADSETNWVTTSMVRNAAKANWTLEELGWSLYPAGSIADWDGLTGAFLDFVASDRSVLEDAYLRRWHSAAVRIAACAEQTGESRDEWERRLRQVATDCGTSLRDDALSSDGLYE